MSLLTRDQILTADDLVTKDVAVPEWGGTVRIRTLTGTERDDFELAFTGQKGDDVKVNLKNLRAKLAAAIIVDENGHQIFTDKDIAKLGMKSGKALGRVFDEGRHLAGLSKDDVEELAGNSDAAQSGSSTSD